MQNRPEYVARGKKIQEIGIDLYVEKIIRAEVRLQIPPRLVKDLIKYRLVEKIHAHEHKTLGIITKAEREVLELLADGHTATTAAKYLKKPYWTVHTLMENARTRLEARNSTHAVAEAIRRKII